MATSTREYESRILRLDRPDSVIFGRAIVELREGIDAHCLWCADASDACGVCFRTAGDDADRAG